LFHFLSILPAFQGEFLSRRKWPHFVSHRNKNRKKMERKRKTKTRAKMLQYQGFPLIPLSPHEELIPRAERNIPPLRSIVDKIGKMKRLKFSLFECLHEFENFSVMSRNLSQCDEQGMAFAPLLPPKVA
jgi:hypothetical protein